MSQTPSPQQAAVYEFVRHGQGSARVIAVAGAGKTTTLIDAVSLMQGSVAFMAYNKKIAVEIQDRLKAGAGPSVKAGTFHSFGFQAWRRVAPKVQVNDKKVWNIVDELKVAEILKTFVVKLVSLAKQRAVGVLQRIEDDTAWFDIIDHFDVEDSIESETDNRDALLAAGVDYARAALLKSISMDKEIIDFDDMIYAPLYHDSKMWQNDWVLVDEAQDTNPARRALAKKMLRPGGRALFVGDPAQAIYGFTGADNDALDIIAAEFGCIDLPLTVTFRCPKAVTARAQTWVNHITAHETAPEGSFTTLPEEEFKKVTPDALDAILCRNTKPLVELAYGYIRRGIGCHVEGRDIGRGLLALVGKWRTNSVSALRDKLGCYLQRETERFLAKGQEDKAAAITDKVETLYVIIDSLPTTGAEDNEPTVDDLRSHIDQLFGDTPEGQQSRNLTLSTIHKAKGREWNRVFWYGRNRYQPSPFARQDWQLIQETNLMYVACTRAKQALVEVTVKAKVA
jgi:DNA helicase-2/ATP-dependent DNA helicase PcrA